MKNNNFLLIIISVFLVFSITSVANADILQSVKDAMFAEGNGIDYMKNGQYKKAIIEFEKIADKQKLSLQLALIKAYLLDNRDADANRVAEAINKNPQYKNASDQIAGVYLETIKNYHNIHGCNRRLEQVDKYAISKKHKLLAGQLEKAYAMHFSGSKRKNLLYRAVRHLGHGPIFGFEIERLNAKHIKIIFRDNQPITILEIKKGTEFKFINASNPNSIFFYESGTKQYFPIPLNSIFNPNKAFSLVMKGNIGDSFIIESSKLSI